MARQSFHLAAVVTQELVDRILEDAIPPAYDITNKRWPFHGLARKKSPRSALRGMIGWAQSKTRKNSEEELFATELLNYYDLAKSNLDDVVSSFLEFQKSTDTNKPAWDGPSKRELDQWISFGWDTEAHLAWLHVWLPSRPSIRLVVPKTTVKDLKVSAGATGEWWVKRPKIECARRWRGICYSWRTIWVWEKWGSLTIDSVTVKSIVSIEWRTKQLNVEGNAKFEKLRLKYKILELIPIEKWIDPVAFRAIDSEELIGILPILTSKYAVSKLALPEGNELRLEATFKKL